ncbi:winged helix-turn-helix domain-containing protein [Hyphococcus sp.]|uniref:winged helix-turn-helix domain-containing protein n=1 Tax=Hyphococcus sp. TaxID=2038636 RepID=UPI00207FA263|nr:MAG: hypothetical protein DHS20C04_32130 [Marinicaulis sp.]
MTTTQSSFLQSFIIGDWRADPAACSISRNGETISLEPKVMDLLVLLHSEPGKVFSREEIDVALWPGVTVGDDTLARAVSKLRRALGDSAGEPRYVETIPKRGYRLIAAVAPIVSSETTAPTEKRRRPWIIMVVASVAVAAMAAGLWLTLSPAEPASNSPESNAAALTERANDLYMRFTRADNEAAIALYQRAITADPDYAPAQAGLANSLVQLIVRWQSEPGDEPSASTLQSALSRGLNQTPEARELTTRAIDMAARAVRLAPKNPEALKALGFAYSAHGDMNLARDAYLDAIDIDPDAWEAMINLGELNQIAEDPREALRWFERAYAAMNRLYPSEPQRIGPWRAPLGVSIAEQHERFGDHAAAEIWYRRVLDQAPFEPEATTRLAKLLRQSGEAAEANALCTALNARIGRFEDCPTGVMDQQ